MRVPVTAERGSRLQVTAGGTVVHSAAATGDEQNVVVDLDEGNHAVEITATDAAGNSSVAASFRVTLDTTPPEPPTIDVAAPATIGAATTLTLTGERSAAYELELSGPGGHSDSGTLTGGSTDVSWRLPNGEYVATARLTDRADNASSTSEVAFTVDIPSPDSPTVTIASDPGASPIVLAVSASGAETVVLSLVGDSASEQTITLDEAGNGTVEFPVEDGDHVVEAVAIDFQEQRSEPVRVSDVIVKTSAPGLALTFVDDLLSTGLFAYELTADEGSTIRIASRTEELLAEFGATGAPQSFSIEVPSGEHTITVAVIDAFGNETVQEFAAEVSEPLGAAGAIITLLVLLAIGIGGGLGVRRLWRRLRNSSAAANRPDDATTAGPVS